MRVTVTLRVELDMASPDRGLAEYAAVELVEHVIGAQFNPMTIIDVEATV